MGNAIGPGTNTGHGHVWKRPDGFKARCGGTMTCWECQADAARVLFDKASGPVIAAPIGCICPPGANVACERTNCPRKAVRT